MLTLISYISLIFLCHKQASTFVTNQQKHERTLEGTRQKVSLIITSTKTRFNIISRHILLIRGRIPGSIFIHRIGTSYFLLETPQMRYSLHPGQSSANKLPEAGKQCGEAATSYRRQYSIEYARSSRWISIFQDEAIDTLLLYTTFSSRITFYAFLCDTYVRTWNRGKYKECQGKRDDSLKVLYSLNNRTFVVDVPDINLIWFEKMYCRDFARIITERNLWTSLPIEMFLTSFWWARPSFCSNQ